MSSEESKLEEIRKRIDEVDDAIADLLLKRKHYAKEAKEEKLRLKKPIKDWQREKEVMQKWCERGDIHELSEKMMKEMAELIIEYTLKEEIEE